MSKSLKSRQKQIDDQAEICRRQTAYYQSLVGEL